MLIVVCAGVVTAELSLGCLNLMYCGLCLMGVVAMMGRHVVSVFGWESAK